ncbi:hypothetical protein F4776DRAFT_622906 [Hypoxylon sp. NC0597]|nr:hypothetical protein F4776DRAFT_622906 [Hypoxylon sp. NC0597]
MITSWYLKYLLCVTTLGQRGHGIAQFRQILLQLKYGNIIDQQGTRLTNPSAYLLYCILRCLNAAPESHLDSRATWKAQRPTTSLASLVFSYFPLTGYSTSQG